MNLESLADLPQPFAGSLAVAVGIPVGLVLSLAGPDQT